MIRPAILLVVWLLVAGCSGGGSDDEPAASPSAVVASTPRPGSTSVTPSETVEPSIEIESYHPRLPLTGVYRPPQETMPARTFEMPERPKSEFAAWDGSSVIVYDTETGKAHDFGPGSLAQPAFARGHFVYTSADSEVFLVDLATMEKESIARGLLAYFLGDEYIVVNPGNNNFYAIGVDSGRRVALEDVRDPVLRSMVLQRWGGDFQGRWQDGRFATRLAENPSRTCEGTGPEQRACLAEMSTKWLIEDVWAMETLMAFEANIVQPAGPAEVVIATTPVCYEAGWLTDCYEVLAKLETQSSGTGTRVPVEGTTNIFLVDLRTGTATFVATATYNALTGSWPMTWPLVANEQIVAWTESYCGEPRGATRIYSRATGEITQLNRADWLTLADGRLGFGEQGATTIVDPVSFEYLAVLPEVSGISWSADLRYGAVGQGFMRGSVCE